MQIVTFSTRPFMIYVFVILERERGDGLGEERGRRRSGCSCGANSTTNGRLVDWTWTRLVPRGRHLI